MKRIIYLLLSIFMLLSLISCSGNYAQVDLNKPVDIPENGIIEKSVLDKIKNDNAIATFVGKTNDIEYRWIIFARDITSTRDVNLSVEVKATEKGISLHFSETEDYGFVALLSVYLNEKWAASNATAYCGDVMLGSVSITGNKTSILNISIDKAMKYCEIVPYGITNNETSIPNTYIETEIPPKTLTDGTIIPYPSETPASTKEETLIPEDASSDTSNVLPTPEETSRQPEDTTTPDDSNTSNRPVSDGKDSEKDKYDTDPVPSGKPLPVEPEDQEINKGKKYTCTFSIECTTILNNLSNLDPDKLELVPSSGVILAPTEVTFYEGESVFDVLKRVCKENNIHLEFSWTPIYNSAYIEGIYNLYEFDCGELSGWMYRVDGWYPNYGCSRYQLADGEVVEWRYTCDLGHDVGEDWLGQS